MTNEPKLRTAMTGRDLKKRPERATVSLSMRKDIIDRLIVQAKIEDRSLSRLAERYIREALDRTGVRPGIKL